MRLFVKHHPKTFCVGLNKTGTTTIEAVLKGFGYKMGNQVAGELLLESWHNRDFKTILKFCKTAEAFQDIPFSLPYTFQHLDMAFPDAKFILTLRDSPEQWYSSLIKFHSKLWSNGTAIPTVSELKNAKYRYKGFAYDFLTLVYQTKDAALYDKDTLITHYKNYNKNVKDYFNSRPEKLLTINVSHSSDYAKLCAFLNKPILKENFPWENKTSDVKP